jgi:hypothetical protein
MKTTHHSENHKFWNIFFVVLGIGMMAYGIKDFVLPAILVLLGYLLVNYGLKRMHKPPLASMVKNWIDELD